MQYQIVFDAAHPGFRSFWLPSCGFIVIFFAIRAVISPERSRVPSRTSAFIFLIGAILWTFVTFTMTAKPYHGLASALQDNRCSIVEGRIEHFHPGSVSKKTSESFDVGNYHFSYSEGLVTGGFNRDMKVLGDPIYEGEQVRIHYLSSSLGNEIARLEIAE